MTGDGMSFTFEWYDDFLARLCDDYRFCTYADDLAPGEMILRHDVDWSPRRALRMARMEADRGIEANYFFLVSSPFYNPVHKPTRRIVQRIESLGHHVGLHFSTHQYWDEEPAESELVERVDAEKRILDAVSAEPLGAISFHRPPDWVFGRTFAAFDSAYAARFFDDIAYRGDSDHRWREEPPLADGAPDRLQVLVHPGLWGENDGAFTERLATITDRRLARTRRFMHDQFVRKKYNIDEFCEVGTTASRPASR